MVGNGNYGISTFWGPRKEGFDPVFKRYAAMMRRLPEIDPAFRTWFRKHDERIVPVDYVDMTSFEQIIHQSSQGHENLGYRTFFRTDIADAEVRTFALRVHVGSLDFNAATITTESRESVDRSLLTFRIFRTVLLALAESFDAERAYAFPTALIDHWKPKPYGEPGFPIAWISYVARQATHLVTSPPSAIVERRPNGALLMAATDETFDVDNPAHMAVAHDIEAAVAPLHGHPWIPDNSLE